MANDKTLIYVGAAAAAYFLFFAPSSTGTAAPGASILNNLLPTGTPAAGAIPTTYGINGGYSGNYAAVVSNYAQLVAANPNLGNPYYQLTQPEQQQYVANYKDIAQGVPTWPGGLSAANIQKHWTLYGCAQKRIFLPLQPPSAAPYIAPQPNPKSSGGNGIFKTILEGVTAVGAGVLEVTSLGTLTPIVAPATAAALSLESQIKGVSPVLSDAEIELLLTGAAVMKDILPYYMQVDPAATMAITNKLNSVLSQYL